MRCWALLATAALCGACGDSQSSRSGGSGGSAGALGVDAGGGGSDAAPTVDARADSPSVEAGLDGGAPDGSVDDGGSGDGRASDASPDAPYVPTDSPPLGLTSVGTLLILGDSISSPTIPTSYANLLHGDLETRYGAPVTLLNAAIAGSETDDLDAQIQGLPSSLPGPVVVSMTIGGNDLKNNVLGIVATGGAALLAQWLANIDAALAALLAPDRFGAGVDVHVLEANVYDPTDGQANYSNLGCSFGGSLPSGLNIDPLYWHLNAQIEGAVLARGQTYVDLWGLFRFHGLNYPPSWIKADCQHPTPEGRDHLRRHLYRLITGETLP